MRIGIIGMGNMGSKYAIRIVNGSVEDMELCAITRTNEERWSKIKDKVSPELKRFNSGDDMFEAIDKGELSIDAVLIVTPHYSHEETAVKAWERGISVLCDKPVGVYSRQGRNMIEAYEEAKKKFPKLQYGVIFNQRTLPVYKKMKEIVDSGKYGKIKRVSWIITDWYRTDAYYESGSWRATWAMDGGGTLINQCPHNLDLLQWICGEPSSVVGCCHEGKYHPIEVEDEVTAYLEWGNGATGTFIASTGEAVGVNRFEISMEDALLVCEKGKLRVCELDMPESEYKKNTEDMFLKPKSEWKDIEVEAFDTPYEVMLESFAKGEIIATGRDAMNSLYISNAIYLSSWKGERVTIPEYGSSDEIAFEKMFEEELSKKKQ